MKKIISIFLILIMIFSIFTVSASAANVCSYISGNSKSAKTFYATTDNWWLTNAKIKINQNKGTAKKDTVKGGGTYYTYGYYTVKVSASNYTKTYKMTSKSTTITLPKRNTKYKITISPASQATMRIKMGSANRWFSGWKTNSTWSVSKTKHVDYCN